MADGKEMVPLRVRWYARDDMEPVDVERVKLLVYRFVKGRFPAERIGEVDVRPTAASSDFLGDVDVDRDGSPMLKAKWCGHGYFIIRK